MGEPETRVHEAALIGVADYKSAGSRSARNKRGRDREEIATSGGVPPSSQ